MLLGLVDLFCKSRKMSDTKPVLVIRDKCELKWMLSANKRSVLIYSELLGGSQTGGNVLKRDIDFGSASLSFLVSTERMSGVIFLVTCF